MAHRIPFATLAFASLVLLVHGARPVPAAACGSVPGPAVDVADVPANGVVVIAFTCPGTPCFDGAVPEVLPVVDTLTGEEIAGEVLPYVEGEVSETGYVLWLPHAPLVVGGSYEVMWRPSSFHGPFHFEDYAFEALPEARFDVRAAPFADALSLTSAYSQTIDCESVVVNNCGGFTLSTALSYRTKPALSVYVDRELGMHTANTLELRAAFWSDDEPTVVEQVLWPGDRLAYHTFNTAAARYCYRVELHSLIDDSTVIDESCLAHGGLGAVETVDVGFEELAIAFQNCAEPPVGYEAEWCSGSRARCAQIGWTMDPSCQHVESRCKELDAEPPPPGHVPGETDAPTPPPADDDDDEAAPPTLDDTPVPDDPRVNVGGDADSEHVKYGCSGCTVGGPATPGPWSVLALACAVFAARIRRRARA